MTDLGVASYADSYTGNEPHPTVWFGDLPDKPANAVAINDYNTDPDFFTVNSNPLIMVQMRWRSDSDDPLAVRDLAFDAFEALHTYPTSPVSWPGGVSVLWMLRTITAPPTRDDNQRWTKADSYEIRLNPGD